MTNTSQNNKYLKESLKGLIVGMKKIIIDHKENETDVKAKPNK
ncbi:MAG: hypothetical protein NTX82_05580 [Candidatus Parcubacteria bacterium]|nr:hypothetical protein [Candidatus Parcubacteria bacterium]